MTYKPSLEKLDDRIVAAADVGLFCSPVVKAVDSLLADVSSLSVAGLIAAGESSVDSNSRPGVATQFNIDPDDNGVLDENDALFMLFVINADGLGPYKQLYVFSPERDFASGVDLQQSLHAQRWQACDINQDAMLTPLDVLLVINQINQRQQ